jgi:hypothetical protein
MADHDNRCGRCGEVLASPGVSLAVQGDPTGEVPAILPLCSRCFRSFARWSTARKRHRKTGAQAAPSSSSQAPTRVKHMRRTNRTDRLRRETLRTQLLALAIVTAAALLGWLVLRML